METTPKEAVVPQPDPRIEWLKDQNLNPAKTPHEFLASLYHTLIKKGSLSPAQYAALGKWHDGAQRRKASRAAEAEALADAAPLAVGRREVIGTILKAEWRVTQFGEVLKCLLKQEDGNRLWGTVPSALLANKWDDPKGLEREAPWNGDALIGAVVAFTATVTRSDDDEHFGFYKRPAAAQIIDTSEARLHREAEEAAVEYGAEATR